MDDAQRSLSVQVSKRFEQPVTGISYVIQFIRSREYASGFAAAFNCMVIFISAKTYFNLEHTFSLPGVALFYGIVGVLGYDVQRINNTIFSWWFVALFSFRFIVAYLILPETENRTLEEIEAHFSDRTKRLTDTDVQRIDTTTVANGTA